jgi:hypothetical protein
MLAQDLSPGVTVKGAFETQAPRTYSEQGRDRKNDTPVRGRDTSGELILAAVWLTL